MIIVKLAASGLCHPLDIASPVAHMSFRLSGLGHKSSGSSVDRRGRRFGSLVLTNGARRSLLALLVPFKKPSISQSVQRLNRPGLAVPRGARVVDRRRLRDLHRDIDAVGEDRADGNRLRGPLKFCGSLPTRADRRGGCDQG